MKSKILMASALAATLFVLGDQTASAQTPPPAEPKTVTVQAGDNLSKIATEQQTTYVRLYDANAQISHPDIIHPGDNVRIPTTDEQIPTRPLPDAAPVVQPVAQAPKQRAATAKKPRVQRSAPVAASPVSGDVWGQLARCESGGNAATNTGNGYYGAYQFSAGTWRGVGGSGLPHQASLEEQTARAQALQARSGWGQWPACSSKLGLR